MNNNKLIPKQIITSFPEFLTVVWGSEAKYVWVFFFSGGTNILMKQLPFYLIWGDLAEG